MKPTLVWQAGMLKLAAGVSWVTFSDSQGAVLLRCNKPDELLALRVRLAMFLDSLAAKQRDRVWLSSEISLCHEPAKNHDISLYCSGGLELPACPDALSDLRDWLSYLGSSQKDELIVDSSEARLRAVISLAGGRNTPVELGFGNYSRLLDHFSEAITATTGIVQKLHEQRQSKLLPDGAAHFRHRIDTHFSRHEAIVSRSELARMVLALAAAKNSLAG